MLDNATLSFIKFASSRFLLKENFISSAVKNFWVQLTFYLLTTGFRYIKYFISLCHLFSKLVSQ